MIADTDSLEFVAIGNTMNEIKKDGIFVAEENPPTASTNGSANKAATIVPNNKNNNAFIVVH